MYNECITDIITIFSDIKYFQKIFSNTMEIKVLYLDKSCLQIDNANKLKYGSKK